MTAFAVAEQIVSVPLDVAFDRFIDFSQWVHWMPDSFRPVSGPQRGLRSGDKFKVGFGPKQRMTLGLEVLRMSTNVELCWGGGPAILRGEHSFRFIGVDGATRLRSEESLTGLLTYGPMAKLIERECVKAAAELLARFAEYAEGRTVSHVAAVSG
jgi:hypothetical protein